MDLLKLLEDAKGWFSAGGVASIGAFIWKIRSDRRAERERTENAETERLRLLVNELREECTRKTTELRERGVENERLEKLVSRLDWLSKEKRLEVFFHNRLKAEAKKELIQAIDKVKSNATDALASIGRAISILEEDVVLPDDEESEGK